MKYVIWASVMLMVILHQDNWFWGNGTLVLGFLPIGLAWHIGISLAAALIWLLAAVFAWPSELEVETEAENQ